LKPTKHFRVRLAIISDLHEDYLSLKRILHKAAKKGYDQLVCLGDISGFSLPYYTYGRRRDAKACLDLVRETCTIILPGNHDMHAAQRIPQHSDVFRFPDDWYELPMQQRSQMAQQEIWLHDDELATNYLADDRDFLNSLPEFIVLDTREYKILLSHYVFPNLSGFKKGFYSRAEEFGPHFTFMQEHQCSLGISGHTHARGFYLVRPGRFKTYRYGKARISDFPLIVGVPPVTRHKHRRGFSIFDSDTKCLRVYRV
jgi:predicted phosphodiesterase